MIATNVISEVNDELLDVMIRFKVVDVNDPHLIDGPITMAENLHFSSAEMCGIYRNLIDLGWIAIKNQRYRLTDVGAMVLNALLVDVI